MLLSQENIHYHNTKDKDSLTHYHRIQEFVNDQVRHHCRSKLMSQLNNVDNSSNPIRTTMVDSPASIGSRPTETHIPITATSIKIKKHKKNDDLRLTFPQIKKHGLHLLEKFTSPNLVIDRVTQKNKPKQTSIGIFNKGKSSAKGKIKQGVADLLFSESDFLHATNQTSSKVCSSLSEREDFESPYFHPRTPILPPPEIPGKRPKKKVPLEVVEMNESTFTGRSQLTQNDNYEEEEEPMPSLMKKSRHFIQSPSTITSNKAVEVEKDNNTKIQSKPADITKKNNSRRKHNDVRRLHRPRKTSTNSGHSFDSIKRLLQECQRAPAPTQAALAVPDLSRRDMDSFNDGIWRSLSPSNQTSNSSTNNKQNQNIRTSRFPTQMRYDTNRPTSPESYLPSEYCGSTLSYYSPSTTDNQFPTEHKLYHINVSNSSILTPLKTLYEDVDKDSGLKNFWRSQAKRKL